MSENDVENQEQEILQIEENEEPNHVSDALEQEDDVHAKIVCHPEEIANLQKRLNKQNALHHHHIWTVEELLQIFWFI